MFLFAILLIFFEGRVVGKRLWSCGLGFVKRATSAIGRTGPAKSTLNQEKYRMVENKLKKKKTSFNFFYFVHFLCISKLHAGWPFCLFSCCAGSFTSGTWLTNKLVVWVVVGSAGTTLQLGIHMMHKAG